ncbi:hypothetical protein ACFY7V_03870 [[Kitasatospora] papulosa]|uniref:hypothetical protein n=1 Tax=Streptomyces TaxID=1883 RepID=UPI002FF42A8A
MAGIPTTVEVAARRVESSEEPERFGWLVHDVSARLLGGELLAMSTAAWRHTEPLLLAAEIEAMAGLRRISALSHACRCRCIGCRTRAELTKSRKDKAA